MKYTIFINRHSGVPGRLRSSSLRSGSIGSRGGRSTDGSRLSKNKSQQSLFGDIQSPIVEENFFDFREKEGDVDIWDEDNLVAKLKKDTETQGGGKRYSFYLF